VFCTVNGLDCLCNVFREAGMSGDFSRKFLFPMYWILLFFGFMGTVVMNGWGRIGVILEACALGIITMDVCRMFLSEKRGKRLNALCYFIPSMCLASALGYLLYGYYFTFEP